MNEIVDKFLLTGNKFMPEMHLKQHRFSYTSCELFTRAKKKCKSLKRREIQNTLQKWIR